MIPSEMTDRKTVGGKRYSAQQEEGLPAISIITIAYNCRRDLEKTIHSVLSQGISGLEYIVVDGGSTDSTPDLLRELDSRIDYWVSEKDKGISDAFNKGIAQVRGDIVGIINSGDIYEPGALQQVLAEAKRAGAADVLYGRVRYHSANAPDFEFYPEHEFLRNRMTLSHPACFVRLAAYKKFGLFDLDYSIAMDYELMLRFYCGGAKFYKLDFLAARMDMCGVSHTKWFAVLKETAYAKRKHQGAMTALVYFLSAIVRKGVVTFLEHIGFLPIIDRLRAKRDKLRKINF